MNGLVFDFKADSDGVFRCQDAAQALFAITVERHDRERFQREGHFVPRMIDEHGRPRDFDGPHVFAGELFWEKRDSLGNLIVRQRVLRVMADSTKELLRLMNDRIRETFFALFEAQQIQSNVASELKRLMEENNDLRKKGYGGTE